MRAVTRKKQEPCKHKNGTWHVEYHNIYLVCRKCGRHASLRKEWGKEYGEYGVFWYG